MMGKEKELYKNLKPFLDCKDHTVSDDTFEVMLNQQYDMLVTSPVPVDLENYYESENYISHTDSNKSFFDLVYQRVKKYTLKKKVSLLNSFETKEKTVLDIGAGTGDFLQACKNNKWNVFGIEPNKNARTIADKKEIFLTEDISFYENKKFDIITMWHVLEHVPNLIEYIETIKVLLKDNGKLIVAVPNYKSYDATYFNNSWAAYDVPRHLWHFSQNSIHKLFTRFGMKIEKTIPMKFDAYYVSLLSEKYRKGKMNVLNSFWIGFKSNLKAKTTTEYSSLIYVIKK
jgi:2-polyprenyl-3-methyl-5-hydroxy-6-metoxy-1,4-benzoquinol methylase